MDFSKIEHYKHYFSAAGRAEILNVVRHFKEYYGENWLDEFKIDNPEAAVIVDIVANHDAPDALVQLKKFIDEELDRNVKGIFWRSTAKVAVFGYLDANKPDVFKLHADLKAEIDKPRF